MTFSKITKLQNYKIPAFAIIFFLFPIIANAGTLAKPANNFGLVGYWSFNEGTSTIAHDFSGRGNTGTLNTFSAPATASSGWGAGKLGAGLNFDGTNDEVITTTQYTNPQTYTIAAWFKTTSSGKIIGFQTDQTGTASGSWDRHLYVGLDGKVYFGWYTGITTTAVSSGTLNDGNWHYAVGTHDGSTGTLYIDGTLQDTDTGASEAYSGYWRIGAYKLSSWPSGADGYFTGSIDEARVYNRALTLAEVRALYQSGSATINTSKNNLVRNGLVSYWTFDGNTIFSSGGSIRAQDSITGYLDEVASLPKSLGKIGQALYFDGADHYVDTGYRWNTANLDLSLFAWVKTTATAYSQIFGNYHSLVGPDIELYTESGKLKAYIRDQDGVTDVVNPVSSSNINDNKWHYVGVILSGGTATLYIDGVADGSATDTGLDGRYDSGFNIFIGADTDINNDFVGYLDDARIYNRALTTTEIKLLYGLGGNKINASQSTLTKGTTLESGLVGYWSFNGLDVTDKVYDRSGQGNHGYVYNGATSTAKVIGKQGQALRFDGTDDFVRFQTFTGSTNTMTFCSWIKTSNTSGNQNILNINRSPTNFLNAGIFEVSQTTGELNFWDYGTIDYGFDAQPANTNIADGKWHHACFVKNGVSGTYYVDGIPDGTSTALNNVTYGGTDWGIGRNYRDSIDPFNGSIDEVRIYNRALSAAEVKQLYLLGK